MGLFWVNKNDTDSEEFQDVKYHKIVSRLAILVSKIKLLKGSYTSCTYTKIFAHRRSSSCSSTAFLVSNLAVKCSACLSNGATDHANMSV